MRFVYRCIGKVCTVPSTGCIVFAREMMVVLCISIVHARWTIVVMFRSVVVGAVASCFLHLHFQRGHELEAGSLNEVFQVGSLDAVPAGRATGSVKRVITQAETSLASTE